MRNIYKFSRKSGILSMGAVIGIAVLLLVTGFLAFNTQSTKQEEIEEEETKITIDSFEKCAVAGYPIMESYPEQCRTPDGRSFTKALSVNTVPFGGAVTLRVNEQVKFEDGLAVTLVEMNDSRCKEGVVCVWAGELSARFTLLGGAISAFKEVRLGTATVKTATESGYMVTLQNATENSATIMVTKKGGQVACTLEAKQCPDGSYVGRTGPKCEFAACPVSPVVPKDQVILREGERDGPLAVQKIYADYITGLVYREYPIATDQGSPITMRVGDTASNGCTVTLTLLKIENKAAIFSKKIDNSKPCPICLAEGTLIDTPAGNTMVQELNVGDLVWTTDASGKRIVAKIHAVAKTPVPATHHVAHLKLQDGRELFVSPGHPTEDERLIGALKTGDLLNGVAIVNMQMVAYTKGYTYDILPEGPTGLYFANGILIGSTLAR